MTENKYVTFNLSKGNSSNDPVGMNFDKSIFGKSLGGELYTGEQLLGKETVIHNLKNGTYELFDSIVATDIIKSQINYRAVYITNKSVSSYIPLDKISVSEVNADPITSTTPGVTGKYALTDVDIAVEGVYTIREVIRPIPNDFGKPGNPSILLDDEYDSNKKLSSYSFKKELSGIELPLEIPPNSVLKLWVRRKVIVNKTQMPEFEVNESFTLTMQEYDNNRSNSIQFQYKKIEGRVPLSNWFDYTITLGNKNPIVMKELLPKDVDLSIFNILKTFVINNKIVLFYYVQVGTSINYFLLVIEPDDIPANNKYVQIQLNFSSNIPEDNTLLIKQLSDTFKSYYDENKLYFFWNELLQIDDNCIEQYFGYIKRYNRISVDEVNINIWTDEIFDEINEGYEDRRIIVYDPVDYKAIRNDKIITNIEHFDDLFILFVEDNSNIPLEFLDDINLNQNELLYIFEKDIENSEKYSTFKHYPGVGAEVFSQRLYPESLPTISQPSTKNNVDKYSNQKLLISNSRTLSRDISSNRKIKYLLDGTRYVDFQSFHGRAFDIEDRYVTYTIPDNTLNLVNLSTTFSTLIKNDTKIYDTLSDTFNTTLTMNNVIDGTTYEKPLFQQNIIDESNVNSLSIPKEWNDRVYKNEWKTIISTLPSNTGNQVTPTYTLQYNFACNFWRSVYLDENKYPKTVYHNNMTTETSATSACKKYSELSLTDLPWVIEPDTFQPFTVNISAKRIYSSNNENNYFVNLKVYFKGNETPLVNINTYADSLTNLSYIFINSNSDLNMKINYLDLYDKSDSCGQSYRFLANHSVSLNKHIVDIGKEYTVNPQLNPNQSEYQYYRNVNIRNLTLPSGNYDKNTDITVPILLYGNGYKYDSNNTSELNVSVKYPFDFNKIEFNDKSLRFYSINDSNKPLKFKISFYDYEKDYAVVWVRITDLLSNNIKLLLYYGKYNTKDDIVNVNNNYLYLSKNLYSTNTISAWHFDSIIEDKRISYTSGRIFNAGEPIIYEKTDLNELRLTRIDKEYMYGVSKVFKSYKFNVTLDVRKLEEDDLYFDEDKNEDFQQFIKDVAQAFKPSYTQINEIKSFGIDIYEAGEDTMGIANNRKVAGLIAMTPNNNVNTFYEKTDNQRFNMLTSLNGFSQNIDWIVSRTTDTSLFKAGIFKVNGKIKSQTIKFQTPFTDSDYFIFLSNPVNQKIYWNSLCPDRFSISSSYYLQREVSWVAVHRDVFGGVYTPDSIFVGKRIMSGRVFIDSDSNNYAEWPGDDNSNIVFPQPTVANLGYWYNNEVLIKPEFGVDGDPGNMSIDPDDPGYSLIISSNKNINNYWIEKESNQFRVKTSSPESCTLHYLVVKNGIEWWNELI